MKKERNTYPIEANFEIKVDATNSLNATTNFITSFFKNTFELFTVPVKPYIYKLIKENEYKIKKIDEELAKKYEKIPSENKIKPRWSIIGPSFDGLIYNINEETIKKMFINLLINEMDDRKQNKISPAYVQQIKELSHEDAKLLFEYSNIKNKIKELYILKIKNLNNYYLIYEEDNGNTDYLPISKLSLDNLCRMRFVRENNLFEYEIDDNFKNYTNLLNYLSNNNIQNCSIESIEFTEFGNNFINISCL